MGKQTDRSTDIEIKSGAGRQVCEQADRIRNRQTGRQRERK